MAPSFYHILLNPSAPHLPLPHAFITKHLENNIPTGPIILSANGGYWWTLEIKQIGGSYSLANGWNNVVRDIPLGFADFLYFRLVDQSAFKLSIYQPNGCEKTFPPKIDQYGGGVDEDNENDGDDDDGDDEKNEEEQEDDDDPFFTLIIGKTHRNLLRFPAEFVASAGIDDEQTITMKNIDGKEWVMDVRVEKNSKYKRYYLSSRWRNFRQENDLSEGDECTFKFIRSECKLLLAKVTKG